AVCFCFAVSAGSLPWPVARKGSPMPRPRGGRGPQCCLRERRSSSFKIPSDSCVMDPRRGGPDPCQVVTARRAGAGEVERKTVVFGDLHSDGSFGLEVTQSWPRNRLNRRVEVIGNFVGVCSWRTRGRMTH